MQLDDLQTAWAAHGALLEKNLVLNERLLREVMVRKIRFAMAPHVAWQVLEVLLGLATIVLVGGVLGEHVAEGRYVAMGGAVLAFALALTAKPAYLLVRTLRIDYSGRVTDIQREVERLTLLEYRAFKWTLLGGIVVWLPAALLLFEALAAVNVVAHVDLRWVGGNVGFGLLALWLGQWLSKKYVERPDLSPWARRVVDSMSGHRLATVKRHLAELAHFTRDEA